MDETFEDMLQRIIYLEFGSDGLKYYLDKTSAKDEIIKIIDEMISDYAQKQLKIELNGDNNDSDWWYNDHKKEALTELKQKIQNDKRN